MIITACAVVSLGAVTACSGGTDAVPGANSDQQNMQNLLDRAPVAGDEELAKSPTAQAIKQRGQLLIGGSLETPLMSQQNPTTGETEGFDATLGKLLAKYILGQPSRKIINTTPAIREALIQNNTVDMVIQNYSITPARAEKVAFAGPYLISSQAIATLKGKPDITKPDQLNGKAVCAATGSTGAKTVRDVAPQVNLQTFASDPECVQALEQDRVAAWVKDQTVVAGEAKLNDKIQLATGTFGSDPYGIGIKHGDDTFKKFINDWLKKVQDAGLWKQAYDESLGTVIPGGAPAAPAFGSVPGS
ncbi:glutamate ABC transporter substrate-binding protein [Amycolatopsis nigrescens]|uniref:glutamate ABC transporter substrate-binding protein n=1 Tax=Amycolatopsis nigrescens TaxID=381445 RepID=UPI000374297A|nr:glutamate ABC transporter substrate-binding protein [Amycolatopsis nigrescens]